MLDEKDMKILEILRENARTPLTDIATTLGVSESTIRKRVRALEDRGVIKRYTIVVDPAKLGYNSVSFVGLDVEPTHFLDVAIKMTEFPEVRFVATSTGDHMIMTEIWLKDGRELGKFIAEKIGRLEGVQRVCPAVILEKLKDTCG
jgi:Lrp/AsnC family transcriptional regulator for asnA, asnC and gidA